MIDFVQKNYVEITAIIGGAVTIASVIVKLTPSEADNKILDKIIKILKFLSIAK
jgi:hypothetical protein